MILITGTIKVTDEDREAFLLLAERQVTLSRKEDGCLAYNCGEDALERGVFTFVERWKDQDAVDFHFGQTYCREFIQAAARLAQNEVAIELIHSDRVDRRVIPRG